MKLFLFIFIFLILDFFLNKFDINSHTQLYYELDSNNLVQFKSNLKGIGPRRLFSNSMNAIDLKSRYFEKDPKKDLYFIMGDSFAEGIAINYKNSMAGILQSHLERKYNHQVINFAVSGNTSIHYYIKLKKIIDKGLILPKKIILFFDISDIASFYNYRWENNKIKREPILSLQNLKWPQNFQVIGNIFRKIEKRFGLYLLEKDLNLLSANLKKRYEVLKEIEPNIHHHLLRGLWPITGYRFGEDVRDNKLANLKYTRLFFELCRLNNIELTIVTLPWASHLLYEYNIPFAENYIKKNIKSLGKVDFLFLGKYLEDLSKDEKVIKFVKENYQEQDFHFNTTGNRFFGNILLEQKW